MRHPGARALVLGLCLCSLYIGYEFARASSLVLFASRAAGVNGAYTASGGFFLSIATLALYGRGVELMGAKRTLLVSAAGCCAVFLGLAAALSAYEPDAIPWAFVACLFAFRETYVSLIGTQVWALVSAELKERGAETSRTWFCIIQVCVVRKTNVRKNHVCVHCCVYPMISCCIHIIILTAVCTLQTSNVQSITEYIIHTCMIQVLVSSYISSRLLLTPVCSGDVQPFFIPV